MSFRIGYRLKNATIILQRLTKLKKVRTVASFLALCSQDVLVEYSVFKLSFKSSSRPWQGQHAL